ncbi:hypothetical protein P691DRAFT_779606 [Macrolepiota fuliginosa MF-IS2]|uniref:Uncharacterized protein n=1 Tax=Macrolepiota fuliginosa MF-IS2 TaxID=1400762 RepID=A0A9P5X0H4_9AGAR|nr:hypothetical protein P691DRAFT_779606 [Macrolepiota fuliginosa MF-IS2]
MSSGSDNKEHPSPERGSPTPLTSPSDVVLPADAPSDNFPMAPAPMQILPEVAEDLTLPSSLQSSSKIFLGSSQPHLSSSGARGHLELRMINLPRRVNETEFESAATFFINRRRDGGRAKILIIVPPSRPVEAISIALSALPLPSTSSPSLILHHPPYYLSQLRFLPGISELERCERLRCSVIISIMNL